MSSSDSGVVEQEIVYIWYLQNGLQKTDFAGIRSLAAIEIVIKSLKPQDSKQLDDNTCSNEVYEKSVNANFDGASVMSG